MVMPQVDDLSISQYKQHSYECINGNKSNLGVRIGENNSKKVWRLLNWLVGMMRTSDHGESTREGADDLRPRNIEKLNQKNKELIVTCAVLMRNGYFIIVFSELGNSESHFELSKLQAELSLQFLSFFFLFIIPLFIGSSILILLVL
ncbi:hypothetical protein IEQ34_016013 [Dendrobium chrysotoxum]|uniref:Uncharacterized protein n=1 Tax=Dendrobium chrysotoxum TaxID=161865 RepID=A0AAV7GDW1_DENCH|nr:hypothetical protein IEQ34_016013 [Dendrobium chrysotoxum]